MEARLSRVWGHAQPIGGDPAEPMPWRYIPRSLNGGTGWGVWDKKKQQFVDNKLMQIPLADLDEMLVN